SETWGESDEEQEKAREFMAFQGLMTDYVNRPESRWKTRWSDTRNGATLYQCSCGSDMKTASKTEASKRRKLRQAYEFNGNHELKIREEVRDIIELLVRANTSIKDVLSINQQLIKNHLDGRTNLESYHFLITAFDVKDARRWIKSQNSWDVNVNRSVDHNMEQFFGNDGELSDAVLYFKLRKHRYDYTCLVLATKEQRLLAKQYGHQRYIILNGTFPTGNKKIRMYIIMVVDELKNGIPVGYLLFSRPGDPEVIGISNHEYTILKRLLEEYKVQVSNDPEISQVIFTPKVAIIDLDDQERVAVGEVWNGIQILFSPFQVYSCWRKKASQLLGSDGDENVKKIRQDLIKELNELFDGLQSATTISEINEKLGAMKDSAFEKYSKAYDQQVSSKILALFDGQREMMKFLQNDQFIGHMEMWNDYGRRKAAESVGIDVNLFPWSIEYLEGFNVQFNPSRMLRFQKKGNILRLDVLSFLLVKFITPVCSKQRQLWNWIKKFLEDERPASEAVVEGIEPEEGQWRGLLARYINTIAFEQPDPRIWDIANHFIMSQKITSIEYNGQSLYVTVKSDGKNPETVRDNDEMNYYVVGLLPTINCHCFHYLIRGGACAHIRAAIRAVNWLRDQPPDYNPDYRSFVEQEHQSIPYIQLPSRRDALKALRTQKERKIFYVEPNTEMDEESDSDSEYEDFDHVYSHVPILSESDSRTFGIQPSIDHTRNFAPSSIIATDNNSSLCATNQRETNNEIQTWNRTLSVATNRVWANLSDMQNIYHRLEHRMHVPTGVRSDLKAMDNELITKLKTILESENIRDLAVILNKIKRTIDLNLPEENNDDITITDGDRV
ncbi:12958_t:CDS:2, partial [Acaulospora colombiana]